MVLLELRFPAGRYHATPWGHHVNEGIVEWPPSPWRILRALCATWHAKAQDDIPEAVISEIVDRLSADLPCYGLPPVTASHTRHYMPLFSGNTTKVFDAFLHVGTGRSLWVAWRETRLTEHELSALGVLVSRLGYLGRAESWVEGCVRGDEDLDLGGSTTSWVQPLDAEFDPCTHEIVRMLAPLAANEVPPWRAAALDEQLTRELERERTKLANKGKDPDKAKVGAKTKAAIESSLPGTVLDVLHADTSSLRKAGWNRPPGSRWIEYARPRDALSGHPNSRRRTADADLSVARFAVAGNVPERLTDAIWLAHRIRRALLMASDGAPVFSGRDQRGEPQQGHEHVFILPEASGRDGRITHVTLYAPMGFDRAARRALEQLTYIKRRDRHKLQLILLGLGEPEDFAGDNVRAGQCPLFATAKTWVSRTPFVPTRHPKTTRSGRPKLDDSGRQIGGPEHDLVRLLRAAGLPQPEQVEPQLHTSLGGKATRWIAFQTRRESGGGVRAAKVGVGFRVTFSDSLALWRADDGRRGPLAFGYGAHFGLGTFIPESVADTFR